MSLTTGMHVHPDAPHRNHGVPKTVTELAAGESQGGSLALHLHPPECSRL